MVTIHCKGIYMDRKCGMNVTQKREIDEDGEKPQKDNERKSDMRQQARQKEMSKGREDVGRTVCEYIQNSESKRCREKIVERC